MNTTWLGYRVDSPAGFVGRVESIVPSPDEPATLLLAVRLGRRGRPLGFFHLNDVGWVDSGRRSVLLSRVEMQRHNGAATLARTA